MEGLCKHKAATTECLIRLNIALCVYKLLKLKSPLGTHLVILMYRLHVLFTGDMGSSYSPGMLVYSKSTVKVS